MAIAATQIVVDSNHLQSSAFHTFYHISRVVHLAVTISHSRKVQTNLRQAVSTRFVFLSIPISLQNIQPTLVSVPPHQARSNLKTDSSISHRAP